MADLELKEELASLAREVQALAKTPSRLEATLRALRFYKSLLDSSLGPEGAASEAHRVLEVAEDLGEYGFTLEELIGVIGPEVVYYPRRYKNELSRVLREAGYYRKQVRRNGARPLVWFTPNL
tara:strand:+ start:455 stop:823 length:369 start_codon:yes stop_codon:yes gene_type:complete